MGFPLVRIIFCRVLGIRAVSYTHLDVYKRQVSDIEITKSEESLLPLLQSISNGSDQGSYTNYSVLGHGISYWKESSDNSFLKDSYYGDFRDLFVANLDTAARLGICNPPNNINRNASKQHPIHYAAFRCV